MTLACQRALFDLPDDLVYMNCAAQSPSLEASHEAGMKGLSRKFHPWDPERQALSGEMERCRELVAGLLPGAQARDIAFVFSTSYGVAVAKANYSIKPGQEVLVLDGQFPSNYYAWTLLAERDGGKLKVVARPDDFDWTPRVLEAIGRDTGLVALPTCHWMDGSLLDLAAISDRCREVGAPLFVDATQTLGVVPFDLERIRPDYVVASAYKWLLSPDMMGYMYVAPWRQDGLPIEENHSTRSGGPKMEFSPGYGPDYVDGARRFDMGASDSMIHTPMSMKALEQITEWGPANIAAGIEPVIDRIAEAAEERGFRVPPKSARSDHFIGLWPASQLEPDIAKRLAARGVHVALRGGAIRVSPYLYNDESEVEPLFEALDACL